MRMATTAGKKLYQNRTLAAENYAIPKVYGDKFEEARVSIYHLNDNPVTLVGKNYLPTDFKVNGFDDLKQLMTVAQAANLKIEPKFETRIAPRGVMVRIDNRLIDPTVGRYFFMKNSRQEFMADVKAAIRGGIKS